MADLYFNWNAIRTNAVGRNDPPTGTFFDETLRDGIQAPHVSTPSLADKLDLVDLAVGCGVRSADLGFPGSSPLAAAECLAIAEHVVANAHPLAMGFAGRTHPADIQAIRGIAEAIGRPVEAYVFIGVSPIRQLVEGWSVASIIRDVRLAEAECRRGGVEFVLVLEDAVRCTPQVLTELYAVAAELGITRITLCDTVGVALPAGVAALVEWSAAYFAERGQPMAFEWHGHNDRGMALSNSLTALAAGCFRV